jgi:hypothetical protein
MQQAGKNVLVAGGPRVSASVAGTLPDTSPGVLVLAPSASLNVASGGSWSERPVPLLGIRS